MHNMAIFVQLLYDILPCLGLGHMMKSGFQICPNISTIFQETVFCHLFGRAALTRCSTLAMLQVTSTTFTFWLHVPAYCPPTHDEGTTGIREIKERGSRYVRVWCSRCSWAPFAFYFIVYLYSFLKDKGWLNKVELVGTCQKNFHGSSDVHGSGHSGGQVEENANGTSKLWP